MERCWHQDPNKRPTFKEAFDELLPMLHEEMLREEMLREEEGKSSLSGGDKETPRRLVRPVSFTGTNTRCSFHENNEQASSWPPPVPAQGAQGACVEMSPMMPQLQDTQQLECVEATVETPPPTMGSMSQRDEKEAHIDAVHQV